jgi:hypothetical protein
MTDFRDWSHENLVRFAEQSLIELQFLREELKAALKAYREINTKENQE